MSDIPESKADLRTPSFVPFFAAEKPTLVAVDATSRLSRLYLSHLESICSSDIHEEGGGRGGWGGGTKEHCRFFTASCATTRTWSTQRNSSSPD